VSGRRVSFPPSIQSLSASLFSSPVFNFYLPHPTFHLSLSPIPLISHFHLSLPYHLFHLSSLPPMSPLPLLISPSHVTSSTSHLSLPCHLSSRPFISPSHLSQSSVPLISHFHLSLPYHLFHLSSLSHISLPPQILPCRSLPAPPRLFPACTAVRPVRSKCHEVVQRSAERHGR
jgi:hypothetical protein